MGLRKQKPPEIIDYELYDDEELIWWGQPVAGYLARNVSIGEIGMNLVMAVFAIGFIIFSQQMFAESSFSSFGGGFGSSSSGFPSIFRLMFVLIPGIMLVVALSHILKPLRNWAEGKRTYYALTDKRAIIVKQLFSRQVRSFYDENVEKLETRYYGGGVGDVIFATETITHQYRNHNRGGFQVNFSNDGVNFGPRTRTMTRHIQHGFLAVSDVRTVEDLVSQVFFSEEEDKSKQKN